MAGILAFAERVLPRAADLWVQASLDQKQRLQQLFFPDGIAFDGNRFNRTAATAPLFNYLAPSESVDEKMVSREGIEPSTRRIRDAISLLDDWSFERFLRRSAETLAALRQSVSAER